MTWGLAQAGNRAGRTGRYLQWWEHGPEWNAVTPGLQNPHDSASFLPFWLNYAFRFAFLCLAKGGGGWEAVVVWAEVVAALRRW